MEFHWPAHFAFDRGIQPLDTLLNIVGYVPVGLVLGGIAPLRALIVAASMAAVAETSQLVMVHRDPSVIDFTSNVLGALLGMAISARWGIRSPYLRIDRWRALAAATLAVVLVLGVWTLSADALNSRGSTSPGTLEAYWKLDESDGRAALDSSGHGVTGRFSRQPTRVSGVRGGAVSLDGVTDSIDFGHSGASRLVGNLTLTAWIKSSAYPVDDAAIVSSFTHIGGGPSGGYGLGFQLDTTIDKGPRTIGFKLADVCGDLMVRYGATPLLLNRWYHVAGVYDAQAKTMDVYLNGELDDGFLAGTVIGSHRSSREALYVGRRSDRKGFEFAGAIDDGNLLSH